MPAAEKIDAAAQLPRRPARAFLERMSKFGAREDHRVEASAALVALTQIEQQHADMLAALRGLSEFVHSAIDSGLLVSVSGKRPDVQCLREADEAIAKASGADGLQQFVKDTAEHRRKVEAFADAQQREAR